MIIEDEEEFWTSDPYPEELTEEVKVKKEKTIFNHSIKDKKLSTDFALQVKKC